MKRMVTYLYAYEKGRRGKNTGFIKADIYKEETHIAVFLQNIVRNKGIGKIYLLVKENGLVGILIGELYVEEGHGDVKLQIENTQIRGSRFSLQDVVGVGIILGGEEYLASCWKEAYEEVISSGEFGVWENVDSEVAYEDENSIQAETGIQMNAALMADIPPSEELISYSGASEKEREEKMVGEVSYEKIELDGLRSLPSPNWHFCNNSFLVHGFWNYGYLVVKKEVAENEEKLYLGVPGIFEKPEMVMAVVFGFTDFEAVPQEIINADMGETIIALTKEKNQELKTGEFGCWFVKLNG